MTHPLIGKIVYWIERYPVDPYAWGRDNYEEYEILHSAEITRVSLLMVWILETDNKKEDNKSTKKYKEGLLSDLLSAKDRNKEAIEILKKDIELIKNPPPKKFTKKKNLEDEVYLLRDPRTLEVFYVGISNNVLHRYKQHCLCHGNNKAKNQRIQELRAKGIFPLLEVIDNAQQPLSFELERKWINFFLSVGEPLTNIMGVSDIESEEVE